jgi:hypothetical protein
LVANLIDARLNLLERGVGVRPPQPEPLMSVVGVLALDCRGVRIPLDLGRKLVRNASMSRRL